MTRLEAWEYFILIQPWSPPDFEKTEAAKECFFAGWDARVEAVELEVADQLARKEVETDLHQAGIIEDPEVDGGIAG